MVGTKQLLDSQRNLRESLQYDPANKHVQIREDEVILLRRDVISAFEVIVGRAQLDSLTSKPVWQIFRNIISSTQTIRQWPLTLGEEDPTYKFIWDNRSALFGPLPFTNSFSAFVDGTNDRIESPTNVVYDFDYRTQAASGAQWLKTSDTTAGVTFMNKFSSNTGMKFSTASNRVTLELRGTGGTSDRIRVRSQSMVVSQFTGGLWVHLAWTYDGSGDASGVSMYLNGVALTGLDIQNDALVTDTSNPGGLSIGANTGGGSSFGPGFIDEASIWDIELTSGEIFTVYNNGIPIDLQDRGISPITANLQWWLRMGDGPNDDPDNLTLEDVQSGITSTMFNMNPGDIVREVPP